VPATTPVQNAKAAVNEPFTSTDPGFSTAFSTNVLKTFLRNIRATARSCERNHRKAAQPVGGLLIST
jgi:hypothetical protein